MCRQCEVSDFTPLMSSSSVEKIKEKLDVSDVIGSYLKIEKAGQNFKAKCPFHNEKTPSFFISPNRGSYYCFGCGAKGDIFTFVQEFEGTDFIGALKVLAERAGVSLDDVPRKDTSEMDRLYSVMEMASSFFQKHLEHSSDAQGYLSKRGLTQETIESWKVGFVPNDWRLLYSYLKEKGVTETEMEKTGLIKRKDASVHGEHAWYDVFRGRIMFPIFDISGRIIAFSGRILVDDPKAPKYLNSPETVLFKKSETLYGLHKAKTEIRKKDYTILVEGQLDLLMCHQAGFSNAVASSGTAFTEAHLMKLQRLSNRLTLAFDSDKAGFTAANKSAVLALSLGMEVKIVDLPSGSDPAELILHDSEAWKDALKSGKHLIDFYLDNLLREKHNERALAKEIEKKVLPYIAMIQSSIEQAHFVAQIVKKTGIRDDAIWNDLRKIPKGIPATPSGVSVPHSDDIIRRRKDHIEGRLAGIVLWQEGIDAPIVDPTKLRTRMVGIAGETYIVNLFREKLTQSNELIFEAEAYYGTGTNLSQDVEELLFNFEEDVLRDRFVEVMKELGQAESDKDEKRAGELLVRCQEISTELARLSKRRIESNN